MFSTIMAWSYNISNFEKVVAHMNHAITVEYPCFVHWIKFSLNLSITVL